MFAYKEEFCPLFNLEYKVGKAKDLQLNQLGQYMDISKENRKIRLNKIYDDNEIQIIENQRYYERLNNLSIDKDRYKCFNINKADCHKAGVYKIQLENIIYVGQTKDFQKRFKQHWDKGIYGTRELLKNGAIFSIVKIEYDYNKRMEYELALIHKYLNNKEYDCINKIGIIKQKSKKEKYKTIKVKEKNYEKVLEILKDGDLL